MKKLLMILPFIFLAATASAGSRTKEYKEMYDKIKNEEIETKIKEGKIKDNRSFINKEVNPRLEKIIKAIKNNKEDDFIEPFSNKRKLEFMEEKSKAYFSQGLNFLKCLISKGDVKPAEYWEYAENDSYVRDINLSERLEKPGDYLSLKGKISLKKGNVRVSPAGIEFTFAIDEKGKLEVTDLSVWGAKELTGCSQFDK